MGDGNDKQCYNNNMTKRISIIGAGAWGTTLAILCAGKGHDVTLWMYEKDLAAEVIKTRENKCYLPGFPLPEKIEVVSDIQQLPTSHLYLFAVPTQFLRGIVKQCLKIITHKAIIVSASKGIEQKSLKLPLEIIKEELKSDNLVALSGPNLSKEIAQGLPAAAVVASDNAYAVKTVQETLMLERFRVYTNDDPLGVQLAGALKNIIAIAAGVADGLDLGNNSKAALMIRGFAEISRLGVALGAKPKTFAGLSGMGDLITTCGSKLSRNHQVGCQIAQGKKLKDILSKMTEVAEGVSTCKAALELGKKHHIELPITKEVYQLLYEGKSPAQAITDLMTRKASSE